MIKCPNCSAELKFSAKAQKVKCEYCGSTFDPKELKAEVKKSKKIIEEQPGYEGKSFLCSQCGAKLMTFDDTAVTFCSYCGSQAMIEEELMGKINPEVLIPFKVTKEQAEENYKKKVKRFIFSPKYLTDANILQKFRGIYMPYGIYKVGTHREVSNKGSVYFKTRGDYRYYHDYNVKAHVDCEYDGIPYDLVSKYYDIYSQAVRHNLKDAVEFNPNYLSGFYVDTKDVEPKAYYSDAISEVQTLANNALGREEIFKKHGVTSPKVGLEVLDVKSGLLPVYFLSFRDKDNKHIHYAVVNGQTGDVTFELPVSIPKFLLFSAIISVLVFILLEIMSYAFPPRYSLGIIAVIVIITCIIANGKLNKLYRQENFLEDKGITDVKKPPSMPFGKKIKYLIKPFIALCLCGLGVLIYTIEDFFYYGLSILGFIMMILTFIDLLKIHNELCRRKIPQLEKRGGVNE